MTRFLPSICAILWKILKSSKLGIALNSTQSWMNKVDGSREHNLCRTDRFTAWKKLRHAGTKLQKRVRNSLSSAEPSTSFVYIFQLRPRVSQFFLRAEKRSIHHPNFVPVVLIKSWVDPLDQLFLNLPSKRKSHERDPQQLLKQRTRPTFDHF